MIDFCTRTYPTFEELYEKWRCKKVRGVKALLEEAELKVLRFEALPLNSLLPEKARLVAQLRGLQVVELVELEQVEQVEQLGFGQFEDIFETVHFETGRLRDLLHGFLRRVELILAELQRRKELFHCFLAVLWRKLLENLLSSGNVSEFPNKHRPPCTTMPWTIRPALAVLWGVCWMFYPWSLIDDIQLQPLSIGGQTLVSSSCKVFPHSNVHFAQLTFSI